MAKKILSLLLAFCMVVTLLPVTAFAAIDKSSISKNLSAGTIYFGKNQGGAPALYRVVEKDGNTITLLYDKANIASDLRQFDDSSTDWSSSDLCNWLNATGPFSGTGLLATAFTKGESAAIMQYNPTGTIETAYYSSGEVTSVAITVDQKIVIPSIDEVKDGGKWSMSLADRNTSEDWWLRTGGFFNMVVTIVNNFGYAILNGGSNMNWVSEVRPAFKLNLDAVLLTSAAEGGKSGIPGAILTGVEPAPSGVQKLTIVDSYSAANTDGLKTGTITAAVVNSSSSKQWVNVNVAGATANKCVSAIMKDNDGRITHYGTIGKTDTNGDAGSMDLILPINFSADGNTLEIFVETINSDNLSDYASEPVQVMIDSSAPVLTAGAVNRTSESTATVKFTSNEGGQYYHALVASGDAKPNIDTSGAGIVCNTSEQTISLDSLTAGAKEIYIVVKDAGGNVSADSFKILIPPYVAPDTTAPLLTAGAVNRTSESTATVKFTSNEGGQYYHALVASGDAKPNIDTSGAGIVCNTSEQTISLDSLTAGAKEIYIVVKDAVGNVSADSFKILIPPYTAPGPGPGPDPGGSGSSSSSSSSGNGGSSSHYYTITVTQTDGGKISPSTERIREDLDRTFTITPNEGYVIKEVLVDNVSVGAVKEYTFKKLSKGHTLKAVFEAKKHEVPNTCARGTSFVDVTKKDWFYENVVLVHELGFMNGISSFEPFSKATRGMIVTVLYNMAGRPSVNTEDTDWYANGRAWAMDKGISDGTDMECLITREQLIVILWRYAGSPVITDSESLTGFIDANTNSDYSKQAMNWAYQEGIIKGKSDHILDPKGNATRAEAATILINYCDSIKKIQVGRINIT